MNKKEIIKKIMEKKEFSQLPKKDVETAFSKFEKDEHTSEKEKIKKTRDLLRKIYSAFTSKKLLSSKKGKSEEWILRKHLSTRERLEHYEEVYQRIFRNVDENLSTTTVIDLGAGVNGFSYRFLPNNGEINYLAIEGVGQLVELTNDYFKEKGLFNSGKAKAIQESLFDLDRIKKIISKTTKPRVILLLKVIDSLEMVERDFSKKLISEVVAISNIVVMSFATKSMIKRKKFRVKRNWIIDFIYDNFYVADDFDTGSERYLIFKKLVEM